MARHEARCRLSACFDRRDAHCLRVSGGRYEPARARQELVAALAVDESLEAYPGVRAEAPLEAGEQRPLSKQRQRPTQRVEPRRDVSRQQNVGAFAALYARDEQETGSPFDWRELAVDLSRRRESFGSDALFVALPGRANEARVVPAAIRELYCELPQSHARTVLPMHVVVDRHDQLLAEQPRNGADVGRRGLRMDDVRPRQLPDELQ